MIVALATAAGWLFLTGLVGALGAVVGRWWLYPRGLAVAESRGQPPLAAWILRRLRRLALFWSVLLLLGLVAILARQVYEFRDPFVPLFEDLRTLLGSTAWGRRWWIANALGFVALGAFWRARGERSRAWILASLAVGGLSAFPAWTGHAASVIDSPALPPFADALHVLAAGTWLGGLGALLGLIVLPGSISADLDPRAILPAVLDAFSEVARIAVGALIVTGLYAAWLHLPTLSALWTLRYGRMLALKLALAGTAFALGLRSWRRLTPRLAEDGPERLLRASAIEFLVAQVLLIVTAYLIRLDPSG